MKYKWKQISTFYFSISFNSFKYYLYGYCVIKDLLFATKLEKYPLFFKLISVKCHYINLYRCEIIVFIYIKCNLFLVIPCISVNLCSYDFSQAFCKTQPWNWTIFLIFNRDSTLLRFLSLITFIIFFHLKKKDIMNILERIFYLKNIKTSR